MGFRESDIFTTADQVISFFSGGSEIKPKDSDQLKFEDYGRLALTTKHIYFSSSVESFRIKYDSIIKAIPYTDGVEIHKHSVGEKPKLFMDVDGVFLYELIKAIIETV